MTTQRPGRQLASGASPGNRQASTLTCKSLAFLASPLSVSLRQDVNSCWEVESLPGESRGERPGSQRPSLELARCCCMLGGLGPLTHSPRRL